jgi:RND family efflux transporter MFP subunit
MKSKIVIVAVFFALMVVVGTVAAWRARSAQDAVPAAVIKPAVVRCAPLERRPYVLTESFHGLIEANARVEMGFQIAGRVQQLGPAKGKTLREGDRVEQGDVLAVLEPDRYEAAVSQAQARTEEAKAMLAQRQAQLAAAQAVLDDATLEATRKAELQSRGATSEREVEKARIAQQMEKARVAGEAALVQQANAAYESARAAERMALVNLQDATLRSPIRGIVAAVPVEVGQMVNPAQPVITIVDTQSVKLVAAVVERKMPLLRRGQTVQVELQALRTSAQVATQSAPKPRDGIVTVVPPAADPVSGLFNVEIVLKNDDDMLRPGMIGKATVMLDEKMALAVPVDAVIRSGESLYGYFVAQGLKAGVSLGEMGKAAIDVPAMVARRVKLEPIGLDKDHYLIAELPEQATRLIVEGQTRLEDGQPVTILDTLVSADSEPTTQLH